MYVYLLLITFYKIAQAYTLLTKISKKLNRNYK